MIITSSDFPHVLRPVESTVGMNIVLGMATASVVDQK